MSRPRLIPVGFFIFKKGENYMNLENLPFSSALNLVIAGEGYFGMRLPHWKEDVVVKLMLPDEKSEMTHPYLYVESRYGKVPWRETFPEMFSEEWEVVAIE